MTIHIRGSLWSQVLVIAAALGAIEACGGAVGPAGEGSTASTTTGGSSTASGIGTTGIGTTGIGTTGIGTNGIGTTSSATTGLGTTSSVTTGGSTNGSTTSAACGVSLPAGPMTNGFESCDNGLVHRPRKETCSSRLPRPDVVLAGGGPCTTDADCTDKPYGFCSVLQASFCTYGCLTDEQCGPGLICRCGDPVGVCVASDCGVDADCGGSKLCASYPGDPSAPSCWSSSFACQTGGDTCAVDADCASLPCPTCGGCGAKMLCARTAGRRSCQPVICGCD